jgi:hypothetical protein
MSVSGVSFRIDIPPSITTYTRIRRNRSSINTKGKEDRYQRIGTYMRHLSTLISGRARELQWPGRSAYMDIFFPKFLVQALRQRAEPKLGGREDRSGRVAAHRGGGAGEDERAPLAAALLIDGLRLERADRLVRERERRFNVCVRYQVDLVLGGLQEGLPYADARVVERHADF